ncbi:MAG: hypothetical protein LLG14_11320 [Nocardiaceae bacterium]|nr:hypothetical protein [Nocardiaceae bacterium]
MRIRLLALVVALLAVSCSGGWKETTRELTPLAVQQCQQACIQAKRPDLAALCTGAGTLIDLVTILAAEREAMAAHQCEVPDAAAPRD